MEWLAHFPVGFLKFFWLSFVPFFWRYCIDCVFFKTWKHHQTSNPFQLFHFW